MYKVVNEYQGTLHLSRLDNNENGWKNSTSQVRKISKEERKAVF